ncbi:MAG TPA: class III signal peptide-containing protein [Candidatus Diapherotrites archaeon]|uniref:Class III signal peptide-containing protein n=1 Tax=Candidatus Iainarchaeum sp. TaxID=3101447 RepID=A0A7J4JPK4_9ARCH|nr:class III signal peptide-containing protein [Candidatus Diapherotrites archaeon]HIH17136.1 class III signal peptide-containing protein [Candidatus Diapherotrites archaeon]
MSDQKAQSSMEVLLLLALLLVIAVIVGLYVLSLAKARPGFLRDFNVS